MCGMSWSFEKDAQTIKIKHLSAKAIQRVDQFAQTHIHTILKLGSVSQAATEAAQHTPFIVETLAEASQAEWPTLSWAV